MVQFLLHTYVRFKGEFIMSTSVKKILYICPILLAFACGEKKKFGGEVNAASIAAPDAEPIADATPAPATPSVAPIPATPVAIPAACGVDQGDITKVTLLSTGIDLSLSNQTLKYELSVVSCKDGSVVPIKDQAVAFDLNLTSLNGFKSIAYTVLDAATSNTVSAGDLSTVVGSDLFGHTGEYAHWVTKDLSYTSDLDKVILEINLKNIRLQALDPSATTAESYLKVGDAAAVTQNLDILSP